jgi:hypothetical protein
MWETEGKNKKKVCKATKVSELTKWLQNSKSILKTRRYKKKKNNYGHEIYRFKYFFLQNYP